MKGQLTSIENAVASDDQECSALLHALVSCRGGLNSLISEVIEDHIRSHVIAPRQKSTEDQIEAGEDLILALKTYLK